MEACASPFWQQGYSQFNTHSRTRTIDIGEHKLSLPLQPSSQHPIERFNSGENALPMGLMPESVRAYQGLNAAAMPGLTFSTLDEAGSWHSSIRDDDQGSSSTDSSAPRNGIPTAWPQGSPVLSSYRSNSIAYLDAAVSPCESTYAYKSSEVIDPHLTINFQDPDQYEPAIKFEFNFSSGIDDADYDQDSYPPDVMTGTQYYQQSLPAFHNSNRWINKVPVTRSQSRDDGRTHSQGSSRASNSGTRTSRVTSRTPLSPNSRRRIERRRSSSSGSDQPAKQSNRPKTYKKKIPFHYCEEEACKVENIHFKNRSELKKHIETQHTKPYLCIFGFAGCNQRFGARNEWKRHIATQHLFLYSYICDHNDCAEKNKAKTVFNRGDLFMKHLERMHSFPNMQDRSPNDPELIAWKDEMKETKRRCERLRSPPQRMTCGFCSRIFEDGDKTWTELIDHVCLHYQQNDEAVRNSNGYRDDTDLIEWMKQNKLFKNRTSSMDVDSSESSPGRSNRKPSYSSSSDSSSARQIKQEQADGY
ncbi:hypothetical protein TWF730_008983 [Orbilia blumenaviensis]|uniref:C2H2-type domain-containing protein n=1 Tax=Orbilia blumenaviensis TaxID=1796055 RepID=A0AAV9UX21_9PEZI